VSYRLAAIAVIVVIGLVIGVAGCGASKVPPVQWATTICSAVRPWRNQITALNTQAQQQVSSTSSPAQVRDSLVSLLSGGEQASERARAAVASAGIPDVDGGAMVASRFADSLTKIRDAYRHARTDLQTLAISDASSFYDGVVAVLARLQTEYAASALDTSNLDAPALREAFDGVDQCR
jgi:MoxR-like ATPase